MDRQASTWDVVFKMQYVSLFAVVVAVMAFGSMSVWHPEYMASQVIESNPQPVFFLICLLQGLFASGIWAWSHFTYGIDADETGLLRRFGLICFHAVTLSSLFLIDGILTFHLRFIAATVIIIYLSLIVTSYSFVLGILGFTTPRGGKIGAVVPVLCFVIVVVAKFMGFSLNRVALYMPAMAACAMVVMPVVAFFIVAVTTMPCTFDEYKEAVRSRMLDVTQNPLGLPFFYGLFVIAVLWLTITPFIFTAGESLPPLLAFCPIYLVGLVVLWRERASQQQMALSYATQLGSAKTSMRRFALQHDNPKGPWAATLGLKTATFVIDCDPQHDFSGKMTSSLGDIRRDEIHTHVMKIIGRHLLSFGTIDSKIYGTINPETSLRSCVDVMLFFACVNIDVISLVERRLKVLTSLFPIVDPTLAKMVSPLTISQLSSKMNWTFFLDFSWVDQSLIKGSNKIQYLVKSNLIQLTEQNQMLSYVQKIAKSGNVIWIGEGARRKIIMEAPFLAGTIESWQIPASDDAGEGVQEKEEPIYLIKFDKLIPHLQQYYNLEEARRVLRDYDERVDTRKFINMIRMHLHRAESLPAVGESLDLLSAFAFYGFREKDSALLFCLEAYEKALLLAKDDKLPPVTHNLFIETIRKIGYPGQILHLAYINKHSLRDAQTIISLCRSPSHPRFFESWVLLLTLDMRQFSEGELLQFMQLIIHALDTPAIHTQKVFRTKCIEVFVNIASALQDPKHYNAINDCFNALAGFLVKIGASIEHIAFFWDAKIFIEDRLGVQLTLAQGRAVRMQKYMDLLRKKFGSQSSQFMALGNRIAAMAMLKEKKTQYHQ